MPSISFTIRRLPRATRCVWSRMACDGRSSGSIVLKKKTLHQFRRSELKPTRRQGRASLWYSIAVVFVVPASPRAAAVRSTANGSGDDEQVPFGPSGSRYTADASPPRSVFRSTQPPCSSVTTSSVDAHCSGCRARRQVGDFLPRSIIGPGSKTVT